MTEAGERVADGPLAGPAHWTDVLSGEPAVLVTGVAGFIGYHLAEYLLSHGVAVVGIDNLNAYYDANLKQARLARLMRRRGFAFERVDIADRAATEAAILRYRPRRIVHLAAQAGVRHGMEHPHSYVDANMVGFMNVLDVAKALDVAHLVYASSSSVYGGNRRLPFRESDNVDHPVSLYGATKKANELMAHAYCHLHGFPATGLRFFTVYGDWGRPDMAYWLFTDAIAHGRPLQVFNEGRCTRDFTHVDDVVEAVARVLARPAAPDPAFDAVAPNPATSWAPHRVFNVGNRRREPLMDMIAIIEEALGRKAQIRFMPMQPGDVVDTWADVSDLETAVGYAPDTPLADGLRRFVAWYSGWRAGKAA